ncbi:hypothetical protein [Alteromonas sp. C1M14]|uniref:hypothetical protein n=1 Tax=Alteromonas sp. C1M14 TaxID=2841567 RepID=UPI001C0943CB|nr:hypothetical protein [Alteromonas sp. C1M14]MBU2978968.1 hypothetical protein [Alteromonas sp. C1M14]
MHLDEPQFKELKRARKRLSSEYAIKHKYHLVRSNYILIKQALDELLACYREQASVEVMNNAKNKLNASVNNFILSARTYTAQLKRHVQACVPHDREQVNQVTQRMELEYQQTFTYRFVDSLYEYVSYYGLSVHTVQIDSCVVDESCEHKRAYSLQAFIERDYLGGPTDFRASVLKETPAKVNLRALLDEFMECLARIHKVACDITEDVSKQSHGTVREFINVFIGEHGQAGNNLFVVHTIGDAADKTYDQFPISMYAENHATVYEYC